MSTPFRTAADDDMLSNAQFDPVFDSDGNLVDIVHLEITTDRSRGIRAMEELAASSAPGDECIHSDGWTGKWKRVLNTPAPGAAHTIKRTKRWNSQEGEFLPSATLIVPFEVVWALFDRLFFGRYSIDVKDVHFDTEDVLDSTAERARNLPGRIFYARAQVAITLHLENGQTRTYTGVGVSYDSVRSEMTGNVYALNSARRMAEKGAVSDAKREALASIGRVFNRAFEDGAQALRDIEAKLLDKMQKSSQPRPVRAAVPAPRRNEPTERPEEERIPFDNTPEDYIPMDAYNQEVPEDDGVPVAIDVEHKHQTEEREENDADSTVPGAGYVGLIDGKQVAFETAKDLFDAVFEAMDRTGGGEEARALLEANRATLLRAEHDQEAEGVTYADLEAMIETEGKAPTEADESDVEPEYTEVDLQANRISPRKETGEDILKAYKTAFEKPNANVDAILMANTDWAKRLTKRQALELAMMAAGTKSKR
jgi:hypothetical protein